MTEPWKVPTDAVLFMQLTPREYLETALHSVDGQGSAVEAKNNVRATSALVYCPFFNQCKLQRIQ